MPSDMGNMEEEQQEVEETDIDALGYVSGKHLLVKDWL
jgi:hypothetical protein